jgi:putative sigma-54 modulation protein
MLFFISAAVGVTARALLGRESERRLRFATDRFQPHTREVDVVLRDVNGSRGGVDKLCKVTARLNRGGTVEIEERNSSFLGAIRVAAKRLRRLLTRRIGGKNKRDGSRDGQVAYRRCWGV